MARRRKGRGCRRGTIRLSNPWSRQSGTIPTWGTRSAGAQALCERGRNAHRPDGYDPAEIGATYRNAKEQGFDTKALRHVVNASMEARRPRTPFENDDRRLQARARHAR